MAYKENIYKKLLKVDSKVTSFRGLKKIKTYLNYLDKNSFSLLIICIISFLLFVFSTIFFIKTIQIYSSSLIISIIISMLPFFIIKILYLQKKQKIMEVFPTYIINLKNYTQTNNDIIVAIKKTIPPSIIEKYIKQFNNMIQNGVSICDAFDIISDKIDIKKIKDFFTSCEYCYIHGGDFNKLLDKYAKILNKINMQKEQEEQNNFSTKIVMVIMIIINLYMIFGFCFSNEEYKSIIVNSFVGRMLVNMNLISYVFIFIFINKLNELED